jgi:uncharacterized membrane protein
MIKKIKSFVLIAVTTLSFSMPTVIMPGLASADACTGVSANLNNGVNTALDNGSGCSTTPGGTSTLASLAKTVVNVFSLIVGIAAVIMIIYGGLRYITSGGESSNVGNAKNTLIYAIIGLIIVALAQTIVHFVLNTATNSSGSVNPGS